MVKIVLGEKIGEIIFATDSTIAMSWCSNPTAEIICVQSCDDNTSTV